MRPRPSALQQWWVLTVRSIVPTLRNGELVTAIAASVIFTAGFYIPLNKVMGAATHGMQQLCAVPDTVDRAAGDIVRLHFRGVPSGNRRRPGINRRFGSMPIAPLTPLAARMSASVYRCVVGLTIALICGYVIGFRFHRGPAYTVGFCLLVLLIGVALSLLADLIGTTFDRVRRPPRRC